MAPRPNVDLPPTGKSLALVIDPSIADNFRTTPGQIKAAEVTGWHQSLSKGFENSFRSAYPAPTNGKADYTLTLVRTDIAFEPTAFLVNRYGDKVGAAAAVAQLTYQARVTDAQGNVVGRSTNTAVAKKQLGGLNATESVQSAVESMFELIAHEAFSAAR
jgi:hypothetical protein